MITTTHLSPGTLKLPPFIEHSMVYRIDIAFILNLTIIPVTTLKHIQDCNFNSRNALRLFCLKTK